VDWQSVSKFGVTEMGTRKMVGWDPVEAQSTAPTVTKGITGYASTLPDTYGLTAQQLAELLNQLRDEYAK
jgi:hypothetical protein